MHSTRALLGFSRLGWVLLVVRLGWVLLVVGILGLGYLCLCVQPPHAMVVVGVGVSFMAAADAGQVFAGMSSAVALGCKWVQLCVPWGLIGRDE
jgi:hypothetical protein